MAQSQAEGVAESRRSLSSTSLLTRWLPLLDVGLVALAASIWHVRPQLGVWPLALIGVAGLLRLAAHGYLTRATPFDFPLTVFLLTALTSALIAFNQGGEWIHASVYSNWAWSKFWLIVVAIALFYALANLGGIRQIWWLLRGYTLLGAAVAIYFVVVFDWRAGAAKFSVLSTLAALLTAPLPRLPLPSLFPNLAGGIVAMLVPFCVVLWLDARSARRSREVIVWSVVGCVLLGGLLFSGSRGAWIALFVASLCWYLARHAGVWLTQRTQSWPRPIVWLVRGGAAAGLCVLLAALGGAALAAPTTFLGANVQGAEVSRLDVFSSSLPLAQDYLFTGAGLGSFPLLYSAYSLLIPNEFLPYSHNVFLDIWIEQGVIGLFGYLWLLVTFVLFVSHGLRSLRDTRSQTDDSTARRVRWVLQASLVSMAAFLGHGMVEDVPYGSSALVFLFVPLALAASTQSYLPPYRLRLSIKRVTVAAAIVALVLFWQREAALGAWYANLGALSQAQIELGNYHWPDRLPEQARRDGDLSGAVTDFSRALAFDGGNRTANQRLSAIALERGAYDRARQYAEAAYQRDPQNATTWQLLGEAYLALGRLDEAYAFWSRVKDAPTKLQTESWSRYEVFGDHERAAWMLMLAEKIRVARSAGKQ